MSLVGNSRPRPSVGNEAFGVFVLSFAGHCSESGGSALFLAGHALNSDSIHGDDIDPREEPLGSFCLRLAVFCHQRFAEPLLDFPVVDDPYPAEQAHASIGETRIAFKPAVVKDAFLLINLKANAPIPLDVCAQMSSCARGVQIHFPVDPKIQQRDAIWETVLAHCRETAAIPSCQRLQRTFIRHGSVCATDLR